MAKKSKRLRISGHWIKVTATGAAAVGVIAAGRWALTPPPLTQVAVLKNSVSALGVVTSKNLQWVAMEHPPANVMTHASWPGDPVAAQHLVAGSVLTRQDLTTAAQATGLRSGEVQWVVPISPASASVTPGERVDLWDAPPASSSSSSTSSSGTPTQMAQGVRVLRLYTSQGTPIASTSSSSGGVLGGSSTSSAAPGFVALAIPHNALGVLLSQDPNQQVLLVPDAQWTAFSLVGASPSPPSSSPSSGGTPSKSASPSTSTSPSKSTHP